MKRFLYYLTLILIVFLVYNYREPLVKYFIGLFNTKEEVNFDYKNSYYIKYKYNFFNEMKEFKLDNQKDLLDIYYTITNNGYDNFTFFCPDEYKSCINDVKNLVFDQKKLSTINGFVHPFNSFQNIRTEYNSLGEINIDIIKTYTNDDIRMIDEKMQQIIATEVKDEKNPRKIIKIIHDYIINHTKYDKERADNNIIKYRSNTAYGVLFEGYGICGGYTDTMALFLNYYDIPNFEISSENHIWNAVYLDGKWLHLDLTWDDPIVSSGDEILSDIYFLITTDQLKKINDSQHNFDKEIYKEIA